MPKCLAFNHALTIGPRGTLRPCCTFRDETDVHLGEDWRSVHGLMSERSEKEWLDECVDCKVAESHDQVSMRQYFNKTLTTDSDIDYLDLKINNTCNLACRMCDSTSSSTWQSLVNNNPDLDWSDHHKKAASMKTGWHNDIDHLIELLSTVRYLKFTGGEPFLIPQVKQILEYMVENDLASSCEVQFISNGTIDISKYYSLLTEFKHVIIMFSVDAVGERYEFIRCGAKWDQVSTNIINISKHVPVSIHCLPNLMNRHHIHEVADWCKANNLHLHVSSELNEPSTLRINGTGYEKDMELLDSIYSTNYRDFIDE